MILKRGFSIWKVLGILLLLLVLAAILFPVFAVPKQGKGRRHACLSRLKQIGMAFQMYATDADDRFPPSPSWMDSLTPYTKNESLTICPGVREAGHGYAMNRFLSGADVNALEFPAKMHLSYDSLLLERNASEYLPTFPLPARHETGNFVVYADGHAKLMHVPTK